MTLVSLCPESVKPSNLDDACVRSFWASVILPSAVVLFILIVQAIRATTRWRPFPEFLTLTEAELLLQDEKSQSLSDNLESSAKRKGLPVSLWSTFTLSGIALLQALVWMTLLAHDIITSRGSPASYFSVPSVVVWLYAAIKPARSHPLTLHFDLLALYIIEFLIWIVEFGGLMYEHIGYGVPYPENVARLRLAFNLICLLALLLYTFHLPLGVPSNRVDPSEIGRTVSPEDYTRLWKWVTFRWVMPLVRQGTHNTLIETDVWALSPTMASRALFAKFDAMSKASSASLLLRLWKANSRDIVLDFCLTLCSVALNYCGPFFLRRILDAIGAAPEQRAVKARAFLYAFLAFSASLAKGQTDVYHLWYGRRASTRARSELMASIYAKALKRKDFSGTVDDKQSGPDERAREVNKSQDKTDAKAQDSSKTDSAADIGKIVNLMSADANRVSMIISGMYFLYGAPFEIIIATMFLYQLLGWPAFMGALPLVVASPLNSFLARRSIRIQRSLLQVRDKRMAVLNELLGAVKFVKFFAWENRWIDRAQTARAVELKWLIKSRINSIMFTGLWVTAPILVSITAFTVYVLQGNELDVSTAFTAIALFTMIRQPLNVIPTWIVQILQTKVALDRIRVFLEEDEVPSQFSCLKVEDVPLAPHDSGRESRRDTQLRLGIRSGSYKWNEVSKSESRRKKSSSVAIEDPEERRFELRDINIEFPSGQLTLVTGPTASGKTALLMATLGEMTPTSSSTENLMWKASNSLDSDGLYRGVSYAAQSPWLQHQSIRENILFGAPFEQARYDEVLDCCALRPDLAILEDGDETEIGARGVSLSGGQKARVALARAVYARSKGVLLDDPLSAVDSHTARLLFDRLICGPLLNNRTVVLVTHHVELVLPGAYYVVKMFDGRIDSHGTVQALRETGQLEEIMSEVKPPVSETANDNPETVLDEKSPSAPLGDSDGQPATPKKARKLVQDEARETGSVKWSIYKKYLKSSSYFTWVVVATLIVVVQVLGISEKVWIGYWGEAYEIQNTTLLWTSGSHHTSSQPLDQISLTNYHLTRTGKQVGSSRQTSALPSVKTHPLFYVGVYSAIGLTAALVNITAIVTQYIGALRASRVMFTQLLVSVVRATMRWHDTTPTGRMLNRFAKDLETIDGSLASSLQAVNSSMATFIAAVLTVTFVFPVFLVPAAVIGFIYVRLGMGYLNTGRDLRRMESNTRSPIFSGFAELLDGVVTVRAFSAEARFLDSLHGKIDLTTKMWYTFWMTNRWLLLHFDALGALAVLTTTLLSLTGVTAAGLAGLTITSALALTQSVYWTCRFWTQLELDLNAVERVVEYLDLPQEPPLKIEFSEPAAYWPSSTTTDAMLRVEDLVIKYSPELPSVLHGVSFSIKPRERVGLLGRTGSGKSTLAMSLLRFVEPHQGKIILDGIDVSQIGLHDLRSRITFIPQEATLFSGTIRENLDPFGDYTDAECLDVLNRVHMTSRPGHDGPSSRTPSVLNAESSETASETSTVVSTSTATHVDGSTSTVTLDTKVSAGGTNFSQGQRQLIAMARALLRRSSIIILDEATSSIDFATDNKIQATIREEFKDSLLLTIAHRLRTVADYDRLIVLDKGLIAEMDTPLNLIRKKDGIFRDMCEKSGMFAELEQVAMRSVALR